MSRLFNRWKLWEDEVQEFVGVVGQYVSLAILVIGIGIEIYYEADIGFVCLTAGGLLWGVMTKIRGK